MRRTTRRRRRRTRPIRPTGATSSAPSRTRRGTAAAAAAAAALALVAPLSLSCNLLLPACAAHAGRGGGGGAAGWNNAVEPKPWGVAPPPPPPPPFRDWSFRRGAPVPVVASWASSGARPRRRLLASTLGGGPQKAWCLPTMTIRGGGGGGRDVVDDDGNNNCPRRVKGGQEEGLGWDEGGCLRYATVGLLRLGATPAPVGNSVSAGDGTSAASADGSLGGGNGNGGEDSSPPPHPRPAGASALLRRQLHLLADADADGVGTNYACRVTCIPYDDDDSDGDTDGGSSTGSLHRRRQALVGKFCFDSARSTTSSTTSDDEGGMNASSMLTSCEVVGALCDLTLVIVDEDTFASHDTIEALGRLFDGVGRRQRTVSSRPKVVLLVKPGADRKGEDIPDIEDQALTLILDTLNLRGDDGDDDGGSAAAAPQRLADVAVLHYDPYSASFGDEFEREIRPILLDGGAARDDRHDKDVPLSAFETLVGRVYASIGMMEGGNLGSGSSAGDTASATLRFERVDFGRDGGSNNIHHDLLPDLPEEGAPPPPDGDDVRDPTAAAATPPSVSVEEPQPQRRPDEDERGQDDVNQEETTMHHGIVPKLQASVERILSDCQEKMSALQAKQDEVLLHPDNRRVPILEFGRDAQSILVGACRDYDDAVEAEVGRGGDRAVLSLPEEVCQSIAGMRTDMLTSVAGDSGLRTLFHRQLEALREHYGRRYESVLDDVMREEDDWGTTHEGEGDDAEDTSREERRNAVLTDAAARATEGFRAAARGAIPIMCREGGALRDVDYDYTSELKGLIQDMMDATSSRQLEREAWEDAVSGPMDGEEEEEDGLDSGGGATSSRRRRKGPSKWYEKVAARALVLGVNYLQGWLALQGIRRRDRDRDRLMPKFPLF